MPKPTCMLIEGFEKTPLSWMKELEKSFDLRVFDHPTDGLCFAREHMPAIIWLEAQPSILTRHDLACILKSHFRTDHIPLFGPSINLKWHAPHPAFRMFYAPEPAQPQELTLIPTHQSKIDREMLYAAAKKSRSKLMKVIIPRELELDVKAPALSEKGTRIPITITESKILSILAAKPGELVSREALATQLETLLPQGQSLRSIDVHICSLRKKSKGVKSNLQSVYGQGYRLKVSTKKAA
jgi:DNA-binding winged helix-turn-helix (wHTH) protein